MESMSEQITNINFCIVLSGEVGNRKFSQLCGHLEASILIVLHGVACTQLKM